jgi:hypothetical protein
VRKRSRRDHELLTLRESICSAMTFSLNLEDVEQDDIAAAAFHGLVASGWVMFETMQMIWLEKNEYTSLPSVEVKEDWAKAAFKLIERHLPEGNPLLPELRRYVAQEVPRLIRN